MSDSDKKPTIMDNPVLARCWNEAEVVQKIPEPDELNIIKVSIELCERPFLITTRDYLDECAYVLRKRRKNDAADKLWKAVNLVWEAAELLQEVEIMLSNRE